MLNLPNALTLFRILLVPVLVVVLLTEPPFENKEYYGLGLFLLAALTDLLDGYIARRRQLVTRLGELLDPVADKILTSAAFISLVELGRAPAWIVVVIIAREFAVSGLRSIAAAQQVVIAASPAGKVKTATQILAISLLILYNQLGPLTPVAVWALWLALLTSVYSGVEYALRCRVFFQGDPEG